MWKFILNQAVVKTMKKKLKIENYASQIMHLSTLFLFILFAPIFFRITISLKNFVTMKKYFILSLK